MPTITQWVAPQLFMEHAGVFVFHAYKHDCADSGALMFHYTLSGLSDDDDHKFDVRELGVDIFSNQPPFMSESTEAWAHACAQERADIKERWKKWQDSGFEEAVKQAIRKAIDAGKLNQRKSENL